MKVSIITITFNSAATVRGAIESVLNQTYSDIEYIVKDGGSNDNTLEIVNEYKIKFGNRLKVVSEADGGIYDAMNKGIKMATGKVVGILNSDDFLYDNHVISDVVHTFHEYCVDCVYGDLVFVKNDNISDIVRSWHGSQYFDGSFLKGWVPAHPTFYVKKDCYDLYGLYDTSMKVSADFDLMMRFLAKHNISNKYMRRHIVKMRYGGESTRSLKNIYIGNKNIKKAFKKNSICMPRFYYIKRLFPKFWNIIIKNTRQTSMPLEGG